LATSNFQIIFYGNRVGDIRVQDDKVNTSQARMGTGGNNMPLLAEGKATAFHPTQTPVSGEVSPALGTTSQGMGVMAFDSYNQSLSETSQTIRKGQAGNDHVGMVMEKSVVRRLTPTECERLQGFPDGWTEGQADSHRYKQMGNAVAVPVVQWIIDRLVK
jgi:DNA (cytosine-5)-methyltransferase 1